MWPFSETRPPPQPALSQPDKLLRLIRKVEARGRYDAFYAFKSPSHKPLDTMTLAEVRAFQEGAVKFGAASSAAGAYQIIRSTMDSLIVKMGLDMTTVFSADLQDALAMQLIEGRGYQRLLDGEISREDFAHNLSQEWASFPMVTGRHPAKSFYDGVAGNKALVSVKQVFDALDDIPRVMVA